MVKSFRWLSVVGLVILTSLVGCSGSQAPTPVSSAPADSQWVVAWGASPQNALSSSEDPGGHEQSFRFMILPTIGATEERVHFSNYFGTTPITIGSARLAVALTAAATQAIDPTHDAALTFNGSTSVTLQPNQEIDSDPVKITYTFGQWLAVSMYVTGTYPPLTEHDSQVSNNFATPDGAGDTTTDAVGASFSQAVTEWFLMTSVEAYGPFAGTVAFFGSSSVDGHNSDIGSGNSYPIPNVFVPTQNNDRPTDWLARSLNTAGYSLGVLNAGLLGNPAGEDATTAGGSSVAGIDRFKHDVLEQPGIKSVIIYTGGVDLRIDCVSASAVEASLTNIVAQASAAGVRVILATIPPAEYCTTNALVPTATDPYNGDINPGPENPGSTERRAVNDWIRTTGSQLPGVVAIADFDQAMAYPAHPDFLQPTFYSTDNFHPNGMGYGVQNSAIPLPSLLPQ
jgi:GDSL-like Lipase/Acylhydrolase family